MPSAVEPCLAIADLGQYVASSVSRPSAPVNALPRPSNDPRGIHNHTERCSEFILRLLSVHILAFMLIAAEVIHLQLTGLQTSAFAVGSEPEMLPECQLTPS